jgi:hypothetical protein
VSRALTFFYKFLFFKWGYGFSRGLGMGGIQTLRDSKLDDSLFEIPQSPLN